MKNTNIVKYLATYQWKRLLRINSSLIQATFNLFWLIRHWYLNNNESFLGGLLMFVVYLLYITTQQCNSCDHTFIRNNIHHQNLHTKMQTKSASSSHNEIMRHWLNYNQEKKKKKCWQNMPIRTMHIIPSRLVQRILSLTSSAKKIEFPSLQAKKSHKHIS